MRTRNQISISAIFLLATPGCLSSQSQYEAKNFVLQEDFSGSRFFKHFAFDAIPDPTHGYVTYIDEPTAFHTLPTPLTSINAAGHAIIAVDSTNVASGRGRAAVRLKSKSSFTTGLVIVDVIHMPEGMGAWPAFWTFGPNWPSSGEIDLIEGVNNSSVDTVTLHTNPGCVMPDNASSQMTGSFNGKLDCSTTIGCASSTAPQTFGPDFNRAGGAIFAMLWSHRAIQVWIWSHPAAPRDILSNQPNPKKWGTPISYFPIGKTCGPEHFKLHNLIFNTTFCGSWAGTEYPGGLRACELFVQNNPTAFKKTYWEIATLRIFRALL